MGGSSLNKCPRITVVPNRLSSGTWSANAGAASARNACASPGSDARRRSMSATQADGTARSPGKHAPRNVRMPAVFATASNSRVILLFPMPASPGMTSVAPWPSAARLSAAPGRVMTASRPTNNELVVMRLAEPIHRMASQCSCAPATTTLRSPRTDRRQRAAARGKEAYRRRKESTVAASQSASWDGKCSWPIVCSIRWQHPQ